MAVEFGDHASGFRHNEVIRFINNEVLMNGGGPEFYMAFRSRPWNEVEDRLRTVVMDPQVPRALKRACTWSALALGVRVVARQREQQGRRVRRLQDQVEEREAACWALASELQRLREERDDAATQLRFTQAALLQAMDEREVLRGRLLQAERSALADPLPSKVVPIMGAERHGAVAWSLEREEQAEVVAAGAQGMSHLEAQMPAPAPLLYVQGHPCSCTQAMQPHLQMPVPHQVPLPVGFPYSTPLQSPVVMQSESAGATATAVAAVAPQVPPAATYPPGLWAPVGYQEGMPPPCVQSCGCVQSSLSFQGQDEYPENLPCRGNLGDLTSPKQKECPECPQGVTCLGESISHSQKEGPEKPQGKYSLGESISYTQKEDQERPQGTDALEESSSHIEKEDKMVPQGIALLVANRSYRQQRGPDRPQANPLGSSKSQGMKKSPKKQQSQGQKAKQPQGKKALESQQPEKSASCSNQVNWICSWCKAVNLPWRLACYKCKRAYMPIESGSVDPGKTY
ncbi:Testis-expressed sequence 13B protein [Sciurus carolinensis]|uniref:Testis-expressed sequence 13B protein n=1 Tax=Sciurus carolinensis TaxID=30640 RepID=A0AA41SPE1_SCICA|nr:putative testis-expressed protein 13C [Sciurus carolinensis]MBZ3869534.1 Testis-expressed sequence 13B protein [Sciurus carolinensis]